jgi:hypothetical protein
MDASRRPVMNFDDGDEAKSSSNLPKTKQDQPASTKQRDSSKKNQSSPKKKMQNFGASDETEKQRSFTYVAGISKSWDTQLSSPDKAKKRSVKKEKYTHLLIDATEGRKYCWTHWTKEDLMKEMPSGEQVKLSGLVPDESDVIVWGKWNFARPFITSYNTKATVTCESKEPKIQPKAIEKWADKLLELEVRTGDNITLLEKTAFIVVKIMSVKEQHGTYKNKITGDDENSNKFVLEVMDNTLKQFTLKIDMDQAKAQYDDVDNMEGMVFLGIVTMWHPKDNKKSLMLGTSSDTPYRILPAEGFKCADLKESNAQAHASADFVEYDSFQKVMVAAMDDAEAYNDDEDNIDEDVKYAFSAHVRFTKCTSSTPFLDFACRTCK